jgi:hypothetical protein
MHPDRRQFLAGSLAALVGSAVGKHPSWHQPSGTRTMAGTRTAAGGRTAILNRFPGDPGERRIYCGVKVDDNFNDPSGFEAKIGSVDSLHRSYFVPGGESALVAKAGIDLSHGRLPWPSMKTPGTWADVASGAHDAWLHSFIDGLRGLDGAVWLTIHHEPWDDQGAGNTPASYVDMYRHIYPLTVGSNVALVPVLQSWPFYSWIQYPDKGIGSWYDPQACDILGLDGYNQWYVGAPDSAWKTPEQILDVASQLKQIYPSKPVAYGEWGVRTDPRTPGKAGQWMCGFYHAARQLGVVGLCYYSSGLNSPNGPWTLDGERLNAFGRLIGRWHSTTLAKLKTAGQARTR